MAVISDIEIRLRADIARLQQDMNGARRAVDSATNRITQAANQARAALAGIAAGIGLGELARLTDGYTKFTAQLKLASTSQQEYARSLEDVKRIATAAQNDIQTTGVLYARIASSVRELGTSQSDVAKITETVNLALTATGATSSEASSAMLQLSQAFGSGVLRGEEFNAVNEAAPKLLRILAESMDIPFSKLRGLAEQGKLTTDILAKAFSDDKVIEGLRENVAQITTISGALTVFKNNLMEVVGQQAHASGAVAGLTKAILAAAGAIGGLNAVLGPALKIGAAYVAAFMIAPPLFAATATAMGNLRLQVALAKLEMASGATAATLFSRALGGVSISAQLAAGSLTKMGLAANVAFAAFVGWEIGKYLNDQFVEAAIAGEIMADLLLKSWEYVKFGFKTGFDALTLLTRNTIAKLAELAGGWFEIVAKGLRAIGDDAKADALVTYADKIRAATAVSGTFASRTAEARGEMEKNIKVIEADTDRRIAAAYAASRQGVKLTEAAQAAVAGGKATTGLTEEQKKALAVYEDLIRTLQERVDETAREAAGLAALTTAEKAHLDLTRDLATGKLKLTKTQKAAARSLIDEAGANDALIRSNKEYADLQQQLADNAKALAADRQSLIESARQEAERNEELVRTYGMSEAAITRMQAARLLEQEAQRLGRELTAEEIEDLQRVIELKERSAAAVASRAELEKTKQFWSDIEDTARATFTSITDGGKNAFQRLKDTAKNTFFDWLYQQTLRKWIINISTSVTGSALMAGTASAAGISGSIGSASGIAGLIGSVGGIGAGALQTAGALIGGQIGLGTTINAGIAALTSGTAAGVSAGLASLAGTLGPIALGIGGAVALLDKAFGRSSKQTTASGIQGTFGADSFTGNSYSEWIKKGGWFRSDKRGTDTAALNPEQAQALNSAYKTIKDSTSAFATALGVPADVVTSYSKTIKLALTGDETKDQEALAKLFADMGDELAARVLPNIAQFIREGETAAATLQRVATNFAGVDAILAAMGTDSQTAFRAVGVASIEARERLVALAGGIETLAAQTSFFNENFLTEAERIAIIQGPLNEQLAALGLAGATTTEQFKTAVQTLVQSGALATEEGAKQYAQLMAIAPQFKVVADYLAELGAAADQAAKDLAEAAAQIEADRLAANEAALRAAVDAAFDGVQRAVEAQRDRVTAAYDQFMDALGTSIDGLNDRIGEMRRLSDSLKGAIQSINSPEQAIASRMAAQSQITAALAVARTTGQLPSADSLKDAIAALGQDSSDQFSTFADYQRDVARTNAELAALGGLTDGQLSVAERQLRSLEEQKVAAKAAYDAEMLRLDGILEWAQAEVDAINGVNRSVLSVVEAIATLRVAGQALQQGATPSNPTGSALTVDQLYRTVLGREGDAAGLAYWKNILGSGPVDAKGYADFINGAKGELEMKQPPNVYSAPQSGTMGVNANQQEINARMERQLASIAASTEKFASQFENASGGGQSIFVEVVN